VSPIEQSGSSRKTASPRGGFYPTLPLRANRRSPGGAKHDAVSQEHPLLAGLSRPRSKQGLLIVGNHHMCYTGT
jgi:hypothetical protein